MRLPTILTTAAVVAGFVPFGQAVCPDGDIAIVFLPPVSTTSQSAKQLCFHILK
jgi:hypothetical protein